MDFISNTYAWGRSFAASGVSQRHTRHTTFDVGNRRHTHPSHPSHPLGVFNQLVPDDLVAI